MTSGTHSSSKRTVTLSIRSGDKRSSTSAVSVSHEELVLPTYLPAVPDKNPMFLEKRVYQGSSGKVYPLPFTDRIAEKPVPRAWKAVRIENAFLSVLVLPELGGRIHAITDKTNGYDLVYNQHVIKPALVGLAGPWISGGIEFNWPQHHRPATFLPVDVDVEDHPDGSKTVWCSDHDPMARMKGMHGICLHPERAYVELKVRAYNRTPFTQTFLWWANVATRVHEAYQSFFPPDVFYVADHARRAISEYPLAKGHYYGVDYGERGRRGVPTDEMPSQFFPLHQGKSGKVAATKNGSDELAYPPNDLSFYANIPTPCSYMCMGSKEDFFGGYDHKAQAGVIHIANHHISPGKKQWTWGNHEFGYAWDRNLTDPDATGEYGPYIEIMAGVYTDNQPDFSFLQPGETKTWSQYWYPIQRIGPAQHANLEGAISLHADKEAIRVGVAVTRRRKRTRIILSEVGQNGVPTCLKKFTADLDPNHPFTQTIARPRRLTGGDLEVRVLADNGEEVVAFRSKAKTRGEVPPPASEPRAPGDIASSDELYITGLHLQQYRHATRCPTLYWREALRRDPLDSRCNTAMGIWHLHRGEFQSAESYLRAAIERLTRRNANPYDGEPLYHLGPVLRWKGDQQGAYDALYKATWNQAWAGASFHALAEIDCARQQWNTALDHLNRSLRLDTDNLRARNLKVVALRKLERTEDASRTLAETRAIDPLDWWSRYLHGHELECDLQVLLDLAHDYARAGLFEEAIRLLTTRKRRVQDLPDQSWGAEPMVHYTMGWLEHQRGNARAASECFARANKASPDYCFPSRIEDIAVLESAVGANPKDSRAPYYLANLLYDRRRREEAIPLWEKSVKLDPAFSVAWRNLGIAYFNVRRDTAKSRAAYEKACKANPDDARLLYERDQLLKRTKEKPHERLRILERRLDLVRGRDDLSVELCALYNQTSQPEKALELLAARSFQPWEGGEGGPLGQWVRSNLALGIRELRANHANKACEFFNAALTAPRNLGEARHLLANQSDVHFWLGRGLASAGNLPEARRHWHIAATFKGDFQNMSVRAFSEMTYYSALSWRKLGKAAASTRLLRQLLNYAARLKIEVAKIDYFATSLPTMLLFEDDLQARQETTALFLQAQAKLGLGKAREARRLLRVVLSRDPNHPLAADLLEAVKLA